MSSAKAHPPYFPHAGYHNAWIAHPMETKGIQGVIGYRRHARSGERYGKYRFRYGPFFDACICPEHQHLYWKTATRKGYRQYLCDAKVCAACPRRAECFGESTTRRMVDRHVWQDALEDVIVFARSDIGSRISSPGEKKPLNVPLRRQKSITASALPACLESRTRANSAS